MEKLIKRLFTELNVPFTSKLNNYAVFVKSLSDFSQLCDLYKVSNIPTRLDTSLLLEMPLPAVAVFPKDDLNFIILESYENNFLNAHNGENAFKLSLEEIYQGGNGAILLLATDEFSTEPRYDENSKKEKNKSIEILIAYISLSIFALFFIYQSFVYSHLVGLLSLSNALGLAISLLLLNKEYHNSSGFIDKICKVNKNADCNDVIHSKESKLFEWLSWADIGVLYFSGNLLILLVNGNNAITIISIFTALSLPLTLVSIYFQAKIIKKWCILCLAVLGILWLNALVLYTNYSFWGNKVIENFKINSVFSNLISYLLPITILFSIKSYLRHSVENKILIGRLINWERNTNLFTSYMQVKPKVKIESWAGEITQGEIDVPINITIVSNPFCEPCKIAHEELEKLGQYFSEEICIFYRFMVDWQDDPKNDVVRYLLQISESQRLEALHRWYQLVDFDLWKKEYPIVTNVNNNDIFIHHANWVFDADIKYTPSIFVNGVLIEQPYTAENLSLYIRSILETFPE